MSSKHDDPPAVPTYDQALPDWAKGLPPQQLAMISQYVNTPLQLPAEYGQAGDIYNKLANYTPANFQYPMADIQKALQAQQDLQYQDYQKKINPILASQGQYDSSYRTNLNSDFLKGQQAQNYGTTANLLTNQATQNFDLSKWLPQLYGQAAQGLQGIGAARNATNQYNQQLPLQGQTALGGVFGEGLQLGDREYGSAMQQYQNALNQYNQKQDEQQALYKTIGMISPIGGAIYGGVSGGGQGFASSLSGTFDTAKLAASLYGGGGGFGTGGFDLSSLYGNGSGGQGSINPNAFDLSSSIYNPSFSMSNKNYYPY